MAPSSQEFVGWCKACGQGMLVEVQELAKDRFYCSRCFACYKIVKVEYGTTEESHANAESSASSDAGIPGIQGAPR